MQIYTKILLGMLAGAVIGLTLGPNSALLPADMYNVSDWQRLQVYLDPSDPASRLHLPEPQAGARSVRLPIVQVRQEAFTDARGQSYELEAWAWVRLRFTKQLALRDQDGSIARILGQPKLDQHVQVWIKIEHTALQSGGFTSWPRPISGFGDTVISVLKPIGDLFLRLIQMVIVPLVFSSLLVGVASLGDVRKLGRLGIRTLALYLGTTAAAVTIGLLVAHIINPGSFIDEASRVALQAQFTADAGAKMEQAAEAPSAMDNILNIVPTNPLQSMVNGDMLPVIFFAVIFGIALTLLDNKNGRPVVTFFDRVQNAMVVIIHMVMAVAPFGVAALIAEVVGTSGFSVLKGLLVYSLAVVVGLTLHGLLVYGSVLKFFTKLPLLGFLRAARPAQLIAFSTSSSSAALPVTMECAEENLGVSKSVSSFVIPLGSTVNMDGTALYQGVAALFIAQVFQMDLSFGAQLGIVLTATMASIGAAGVPGAGMVTLAMVLTSAGIPAVGVALILGMDRLLDMFRTMLNVTGDLAVTAAMAAKEGETLMLLSTAEDQSSPDKGFEHRLEGEPHAVQPAPADAETVEG